MKSAIYSILVALLLVTPGITYGEKESEHNKDGATKIDFAALPEPARKTFQAQIDANGGGKLEDIKKEEEKGAVTYESLLVTSQGAKLEVEVASDGKLIKVKATTDKEDDDDEEDDDENHQNGK